MRVYAVAFLSMIAVLSFVSIPIGVVAQDYSKIGISVGDTARYSFAVTGNPTMSMGVNFTDVTGTVVTLNRTDYDPDGVKYSSQIVSGDVSTGENTIYEYLIAADLSAPDPMFIGAPPFFVIDETVSKVFAGASRTVNHVYETITYGSSTIILDFYYDKLTGLKTQYDIYISDVGQWQNYTLTSTSLWGAGDITPPAAIGDLSADNPTGSSITLTWTAPGDDGTSGTAAGYLVRYSTAGSITDGNWNLATIYAQSWEPSSGGTPESYDVLGLSEGTTYWFAVKAYDEVPNYAGCSNSPSATTLTPDTTAPVIISDLVASDPTSTSITLTWTAPGDDGMSGNATGYMVKYSASGSITDSNWTSARDYAQSWTPAKNGTAETHTVAGLFAATKYWFAIRAYDEVPNYAGCSNSPSAITFTSSDATPPAAIGDLAAINPTSTSITLTWTAPGDNETTGTATAYIVKYSTSGSVTDSNWDSATTYAQFWVPLSAGTPETHVVSNLSPDTAYWFAVKACDEVPNNGGTSNSPSGKTSDFTTPATIADLSAGNATANSITLTWTAPGDNGPTGTATGYIVKYSTMGAITDANWNSAATYNQSWTPLAAGSAETQIVTGLSSDTTYWFAIRAYDEVPNYGDVSTTSPSAKTLAGAAQPQGIDPTTILFASILLAVTVAVIGAALAVHHKRRKSHWVITTPQGGLSGPPETP